MAARDKSIPTGRLHRGAKVAGLVGGQLTRVYATKAANLARTDEARSAANARRRMKAADEIVTVLGQMKGAAMKVGQIASFMEVSGLPPEARESFQAKLAELRDSAPRVAFADMKQVIERELGERVASVFAEFDPEPVAGASIGQVYRARLHDGRAVAVKVQYPRVAAAVRADLQGLGLLLRAVKRFVPGLDAGAVAAEIRERITEELDYEHEAQAQRAFARRFRGHPFIFVPDVVTDLCRERVLVSEWVDGAGFEEVRHRPRAERDRFGEIIFRFFFGSLYRWGYFSGDPHPGNCMLLPDGRAGFIDFGQTKLVPRGQVQAEIEVIRAALEGDATTVHDGLAALGFFVGDDGSIDPSRLLDHVRALNAWYAIDRDFTITPEYVSQLMLNAGDPRSQYWDLMKREGIPAGAFFARRMEGMTLGVVGQLEATANWHRIMDELLFGAPPATPLGAAEAAFFAARGATRRAA